LTKAVKTGILSEPPESGRPRVKIFSNIFIGALDEAMKNRQAVRAA